MCRKSIGNAVRMAQNRSTWNQYTLHKGMFFGYDTNGLFISHGKIKGDKVEIKRCGNGYNWRTFMESGTNTALTIKSYQRIKPSKSGSVLFLHDEDGQEYKAKKLSEYPYLKFYVKVNLLFESYWREVAFDKMHYIRQAFWLYSRYGAWQGVDYYQSPKMQYEHDYYPPLTSDYKSASTAARAGVYESGNFVAQLSTTGGLYGIYKHSD